MARRLIEATAGEMDEALVSRPVLVGITAISQANPGVVTAAGHGLSTGDRVGITGVVGMVEVNDRLFTATFVSGTQFSIGVNTTAYTAYSSGGTSELLMPVPNNESALVYYNDNLRDRPVLACQRALERMIRELGS
jgi:hypothetical protein